MWSKKKQKVIIQREQTFIVDVISYGKMEFLLRVPRHDGCFPIIEVLVVFVSFYLDDWKG